MVLYSNYIVLEHGIFEGFLELENGKIKGLYEKWQGEYKDYSDKIIFPGFIDIHVLLPASMHAHMRHHTHLRTEQPQRRSSGYALL